MPGGRATGFSPPPSIDAERYSSMVQTVTGNGGSQAEHCKDWRSSLAGHTVYATNYMPELAWTGTLGSRR